MESSPSNDAGGLEAVRAALSEGRLSDAESLCRELLGRHADDPDVGLLYGILAVKNRNGSLAEPILRRVLDHRPDSVEALVWLAKVLKDSMRKAPGRELLSRALSIDPNSPVVLNALAAELLEEWRNVEAIELLGKAINAAPEFALAHDSLGRALHHERREEEADEAFRTAIALDPDGPSAYANLGWLLTCRGATEAASILHAQALDRFRDSASKLYEYAEACTECGNIAEAERALSRAAELDPLAVAVRQKLASVLLRTGDFDRAYAEYRRAVELNPSLPLLYQELANCRKVEEEDRTIIDRMISLLRSPRINIHDRLALHYALGKAHDDLGEYAKAMQHFEEANGIGRVLFADNPLDRARHTRFVTEVSKSFTTAFFEEHLSTGVDSDTPILIVGMMRSGTTLVEQIVSSHPEVGAAGEVTYLLEHEAEAFDPRAEIDPKKLHRWAHGYLSRLRVGAPGHPRVTDKLPSNFLIAGLIHLALPNAKFIHCRRNPLDTCLSIYVTPDIANFAHTFSDIAYYYREYERLMAHWRRVLPPDRLFELDYEELVRDPGSVVTKLIEFLGLPWSDAVMNHGKNKRMVATPSVWQARQPIYTTSVERWRRYEPWLGDLLREFPDHGPESGKAYAG